MKVQNKSKEVLNTHNLARKEALEAYLTYKDGKVSIEKFWEFISTPNEVKWMKVPIRTRESLLAVPAEEEIVAEIDGKKIILEKGNNIFAMILADAKEDENIQKLLLGMDCSKLLYKFFAFYCNVLNDSLKSGEIEPRPHEIKLIQKLAESHHIADILNNKHEKIEEEKKYIEQFQELAKKYPTPQPKSQIRAFIEKLLYRDHSNQKEHGNKNQNDTLLLLLIGILAGMAISYLTRSKIYCSGTHMPMFSCNVDARLSDRGLEALEKVMIQNFGNTR